MTTYRAPLRNVRFLTEEVFNFPAHYAALGVGDETSAVNAILDEAARFCEHEIAPLNASGDAEGCHFEAGQVRTPKGFKEAYQKYVAGGWPGISAPAAHGGQGLPESIGVLVTEMAGTANTAWAMYPGVSHGAIAALHAHGNDQQKETYLRKLIEGSWTGTMCLTEPHCGSDLGLVKTRAQPQSNGSYRINGTKIFISAGEHDLADNVVHLVLAKLPDAPSGTRGISLFIVPKFVPDAPGGVGPRNTVTCGAIEHKMGIKGSSTCVMNFDDAVGYLVGEPNKGLNCMFTFMNVARLMTGLQGLCLGERSYQAAVAYASERLQMRSLSGPKAPEKPADPIIVHPDVRRMLLTMKALNEGNRALAYFAAQKLDVAQRSGVAHERDAAEAMLSFVTPICKAFTTETGFEVTNLGMQVFGGHGYIRETGVEQFLRDCRIATIYEGTTGIQALDLLSRKVLADRGATLRVFIESVRETCVSLSSHPRLAAHAARLTEHTVQWESATTKIAANAMSSPEDIGAAAVDYLMCSGYVALGYFWLRMAAVAELQLADGSGEAEFYRAKIGTCDFYFERLLPRASTHLALALAGKESLMAMPAEQFAL